MEDILPGPGIEAYVVVFPAEGGEATRLNGHPWMGVSEIAWLPDQSGLVVAASEGFFGSQLWELSYPAGTVRRITNDVNDYSGVSLTADGRVIAVGLDEQSFSLQVAETEGAASTRPITSGRNRRDGIGIAWTPDGRIVHGTGSADGGIAIWITGVDGSGARRLSPMTAVGPRVSADGGVMVFTALRNGVHLWKMDLDGQNPVQLTHGVVEDGPAVSPDGRWLVYSDGVESRICRKPIAGGDSVLVSPRPGSNNPIVSPDGTRIAFRSYDPETRKLRTYIVPFEGGDPVAVLDFPRGSQAWSPDGRAILYADDKDGVGNLWSQPLTGGAPRQMTRFTSDRINDFALSADGKQVALSRGNSSSDVVLITDFR